MKKILAINSGSSSFKFKLFTFPDEKVISEGMADRVGLNGSTFTIKVKGEKHQEKVDIPDSETAVTILLENLKKYDLIDDPKEIIGIGHRIVAGGEEFKDSTLIDEKSLQKIYDLKQYAPLHNTAEADVIKAFMKVLPGVPEVAVFDTSFHQTLDPVHYLYSLPYKYYEKYGARKYGAHGTSVRYVSQKAAEIMKRDLKDLKLIVCHLGSGASVTAVKDGKSFDTSMGFTPLTGIQMATRSGDVDVSLVAYMMKKLKVKSVSEILYMLNKESGFLGVSGVSLDMRDVEAAAAKNNKRAELAIKLFYNDIVKYIGQYYMEMEGIDGIVFTAGIGENSPETREAIMNKLSFLGVTINRDENSKRGTEGIVSGKDSSITVMRIPTDEEYMICCDVEALMNK